MNSGKNGRIAVALVIFGALAWAGLAAEDRPFTVHPLPIGTSASTEEIVTTVRGVHDRCGISRFVLHAPGHGVRLTGYYDANC